MSCSACSTPCPAPGIVIGSSGEEALIVAAKGMDWQYDGYLTDDNGAPIDISTWTFFGTVKRQTSDATALINMTTSKPTPLNGHYRIVIPGTATSPLPSSPNPGDWVNNYVFRIWFTNVTFPNGFLMFRGGLLLIE